MGLELEDQQCVLCHPGGLIGLIFSCSHRRQVLEHLKSKQQRTDTQKAEIQEWRNTLTQRIKLWKTARAVYMPQNLSEYPLDEQDPSTSNDPYELDESKPELWPLFLPSELPQESRSLCYKGVVETERTLRLAQVQDNLVDLRRLRRTLRSLRTYFRSNVVGEGVKTQTKLRTIESGVTLRITRAVRRYRLAYTALLSLDPVGDWRGEYQELTDMDNRGPGKELHERGVGDGRYMMSWIWRGSSGAEVQNESDFAEGEDVNETVHHEWMTCRARADRWREESDLLQEEMRRVIAFLEWRSFWWCRNVGSRLGSVTADIQHGIDSYACKQANTYHELAVSLGNQWIPHLLLLGLDISWTKTYPWAANIVSPAVEHPLCSPTLHGNPMSGNQSPARIITPCEKQDGVTKPVDYNSDGGDESEDESDPEVSGEDCIYDEGESSDGLGMGFEYNDEYMP